MKEEDIHIVVAWVAWLCTYTINLFTKIYIISNAHCWCNDAPLEQMPFSAGLHWGGGEGGALAFPPPRHFNTWIIVSFTLCTGGGTPPSCIYPNTSHLCVTVYFLPMDTCNYIHVLMYYLNSWCATEACFHKHIHRSAEVLLWSLSPPLNLAIVATAPSWQKSWMKAWSVEQTSSLLPEEERLPHEAKLKDSYYLSVIVC